MDFKQYPSYKDSGVEWLGEVPEHWVGSKFKYIFQEKQHTKNMNLPFGAISFGSVVYKEDKANLTDELKENYQEVLQGEFLVNPLNLNYDLKSLRTALSKIDVVVSSGYFVLKLKNNTFNKRYLEYLLYIFDIRKMKTLGAGIRQTLTFKDMAVCDVAIPSACEQTQIASFLDSETSRIDNLIAKQEKLIELLEEQRKSIISHAVTKGLNPNAPMKDSGVEWLGEVPEHWKLTPLKHLVHTQKGFAFSSHIFKEDGIGITKASDIKNGSILQPSTFIDENHFDDYQKYQLYFNDIIISTVGSTPDVINSAVGQIGLLPQDLQGCLLNQNTVIFRSQSNKIDQKFLYYVLLSKGYRSYLDLYAHGTANQASLSIVDMLAFSIPLPPKKEQMDIVIHIEEKSSLILQLIEKQKELIVKLKNYRTSIISHAVTGKIDVREFGV